MSIITKVTTVRAGAQWAVTTDGPFQSVAVSFDDKPQQVFTTTALAGATEAITITPPGSYQPPWLDPPAPPKLSGNVVKASPNDFKASNAKKKDGDTFLIECGHEYDLQTLIGDSFRVNGTDVKIGAWGVGKNPVLFIGGKAKEVVSLSGVRIVFENIDVKIKGEAGRQKTSGFSLSGSDISVIDCNSYDIGEHVANIKASARRFQFVRCKNLGITPGYAFYCNGSDGSWIDCDINHPGLHGIRANECGDLFVKGCKFTGVKGGIGMSARLSLGIVNRFAAVGNTFTDAEIGIGPNMNKDGLRDAGDNPKAPVAERHKILIAKKCSGGEVLDNTMTRSKIEVYGGAVGINCERNAGAKYVIKTKPSTIVAYEGSKWPIPAAKQVTVDGKTWAM